MNIELVNKTNLDNNEVEKIIEQYGSLLNIVWDKRREIEDYKARNGYFE